MKIGQGFDAHRFTAGEFIVLGGVNIPHNFGIDAHSDGDVLLHALCDALLGAAGLGDIGRHYSDQDDKHKNRDSREFVVDIREKLHRLNLNIVNVDTTIILQVPKVSAYIDEMKKNIANDLNIDEANVNVKATTTENMGFVGREEGIAAMAVVMLQ